MKPGPMVSSIPVPPPLAAGTIPNERGIETQENLCAVEISKQSSGLQGKNV